MRAFIILGAVGFLAGCISPVSNSVVTAQPFVGLQERIDRTELRELVGVDPVRTEWCAAFVNAILELDNIPSNRDHRYPLTARAFLDWGTPVHPQDIQLGDVVVFPRGNAGWQGHVGFYVETQVIDGRDFWIILGGNQDNSVRYDLYPAHKSLGVRRWIDESDSRPARFPVLANLQLIGTSLDD